MVVLDANFARRLTLCKNQRHRLVLSNDNVHQQILQSYCTKGTLRHIQLKMVVSDVAFLWQSTALI